MTQDHPAVFGGVDTHKHTHVAAVLDGAGRVLGSAAFDADTAGYTALLGWLGGHGSVERVGVEGTGSYGAGLGTSRPRVTPTRAPKTTPSRQRQCRSGAQARPSRRSGRCGAPLRGQARRTRSRCRRDRPRARQRPPAGTEHGPHRRGAPSGPAQTVRPRCGQAGAASLARPGCGDPPRPELRRLCESQPGAAGRLRRRRGDAAALLVAAGDNPERLRARRPSPPCAATPRGPQLHRLQPPGCGASRWSACASTSAASPTPASPPRARPDARYSAASNATSHARSTS